MYTLKMAEVKLFGSWGSPFSKRVEMGLNFKGIEYEFIDEDMNNKSDLLLKYNPVHKKIPVLLHNGKPIAESLVILEYIDETFDGPAILPKDPYDRAMARFWAKFIDEKFQVLELKCVITMFKACWTPGVEGEKFKEEARERLNILENEIKGKKLFGGDKIGLVDIAANFIAYWFVIMEEFVGLELLTKDNYPNLCGWINEYVNDIFVKKNLPPKEKLAAVCKVLARPPTSNEYRPKV